jgi:hypothetical protein
MVLRSRKAGVAFMALTGTALAGLLYFVARRVAAVMEQMTAEIDAGTFAFTSIVAKVRASASVGNSAVELLCLGVIVCCWAGSALHAYYLGRRLDEGA